MTKRKVMIYVVEAVVLLLIAFLIYYFVRMNDRDKIVAEAFLREYYEVNSEESLLCFDQSVDLETLVNAFDQWVTEDALANAMSIESFMAPNRAAELNGFSIDVNDLQLSDDLDESDSIADFTYTIDLTLRYENGETELVESEGVIILTLEDQVWMVTRFEPNDGAFDSFLGGINVQNSPVCQ